MLNHNISELFKISMDSIRDLVDVNTVIGKEVKLNENISVIPISKVKSTFLTGGVDQKIDILQSDAQYPFGGATGGSVNITPIAFLVRENNETKILHLDDSTHLYEKIIDTTPELIEKLKTMFFSKE